MNENTEYRGEAAGSKAAVYSEVRRIRRLLREMYKMAEHSSMTGSMTAGEADAAAMYNLILRRLNELDISAGPLFPDLPADASFERVGVASKLLYGYLEEDEEDPEQRAARAITPNIVIGGISSLGDLDKLRDIGQQVRDNLADLIRGRVEKDKDEKKVKIVIEGNPFETGPASSEAKASEPHPDLAGHV